MALDDFSLCLSHAVIPDWVFLAKILLYIKVNPVIPNFVLRRDKTNQYKMS